MQTISTNRLQHLAHDGKITGASIIDNQNGYHLTLRTSRGESLLLSGQNDIQRFPTLKEATDYLHTLGIPHATGQTQKAIASLADHTDPSYDAYIHAYIRAAQQDFRPPIENSNVIEAARSIINAKKRGQHA